MFARPARRVSYQNSNRPRTYQSRLTKKERGKNLRTTVLMSILTAGLLAGLVYWGLPVMLNLTSWWTSLNTASGSSISGDTIPPTIPRLLVANKFTNQSTMEIRGFGEPESVVSVVINGEAVERTTVEANGSFSVGGIALITGANQISAYATDKANNESQLSAIETVMYDNTPPQLEMTKPEGNIFRGAQSQTVEIEGSVNEEARVWINERLAIVDQGVFRSSFRLSEGDQEITIKAIDLAGNEATTSLTLTYQP